MRSLGTPMAAPAPRLSSGAGRPPYAARRETWPVLEAFYERFFSPLARRAACKHGLSDEDAKDIVQEAFLLALTKLGVSANIRVWLVHTVDYLSVNLQRTTARRADLLARWGGQEENRDSAAAITMEDCD